MNPTQRIKIINGIEYWYEETPYYDPVSKQTRHKSKYIGRNIDGKPVRVRSAPDDIKAKTRKKTSPTVRSSHDYGSILLLQHVMHALKLDQYLHTLLTDTEVAMVTAMSFNRLIRPLAMNHISTWYSGTALVLDDPKVSLSGQRISELLEKIGSSNTPDKLMGMLLTENNTKRTLVYDLTSLSSYSSLIRLLEYGYNRDGQSLPQINLSLIMDKDLSIPVMYDIYPGSIPDIVTLSGTLTKLQAYGVEDFTAIMDRGFFSEGNLLDMLERKISFIIAAKINSKKVKLLLTDAQADIDQIVHLQKYKDRTIYVKPVVLPLEGHSLEGYLYYDPKSEREEKEAFTSRLYDIREKLCAVELKKNQVAYRVVLEKAGDLMNFFDWAQVDNRIDATIRQNAVSQRMNRMGQFMLFHSGQADWITCLSLYRERDCIEKEIKGLKNELAVLPLNTHSENTTRGYLFVAFLSLILRSKLLKMIKDSDILKRYSVEGVLLELEKWRKITLADGQVVTTVMTKKQRTILGGLKLTRLIDPGG
jgi:transposase